MIKLCYSGKSMPSAIAIAEASNGEIEAVRSSEGDVNWGRASANTSLNPNIENSTNKRVMRELFEVNDVPMPKLIDLVERERTAGNFPIPLVGRPDKHMKGRGFWLINSWSDVLKARRGTSRKQPATHFMEFVQADREYRVHIFNGKSIRISEKAFFTDDTSHRDYTTAKPTHDVKNVRKAAKRAVNALGLDFGAVDILSSGNGNENVYVLEVNAAPGLGGSMPKLYADKIKQWYEEL